MSESEAHSTTPTEALTAEGYWPAVATERLSEGKYAEVIRSCREHFETSPFLTSGRLAYARALYHSGQTEQAAEEFHHILTLDPDNQVALKYLGDIRFASDDQAEALACYGRILELDPGCRGLKSELKKKEPTTTRTITLTRSGESRPGPAETPLREIPFYTETMGDLYLQQGHSRLAAEVFRRLCDTGDSPRLKEKLARAESKIRERES